VRIFEEKSTLDRSNEASIDDASRNAADIPELSVTYIRGAFMHSSSASYVHDVGPRTRDISLDIVNHDNRYVAASRQVFKNPST